MPSEDDNDEQTFKNWTTDLIGICVLQTIVGLDHLDIAACKPVWIELREKIVSHLTVRHNLWDHALDICKTVNDDLGITEDNKIEIIPYPPGNDDGCGCANGLPRKVGISPQKFSTESKKLCSNSYQMATLGTLSCTHSPKRHPYSSGGRTWTTNILP